MVDDVAQDLEPLIGVVGSVSVADFSPVDGAVNLQPIIDAQPKISSAATSLDLASARTAEIEHLNTVPVVRQANERLAVGLRDASAGMDVLNRAAQLLPAMLGATEPRNYLLLFQNPAEPRSSGGIPGAVAMVGTDNGSLALVKQASSVDFYKYPDPVLPLPVDTRALYGDITGRYLQDVTLTPNFELSAQLAHEMWRLEFGVVADGVISIDPVTLSYVLEATGPITLASGDVLSAENAVQLLLVDVYARYTDPDELDNFFASAASAVFTAVAVGQADPAELIRAFAKAGDEDRVMIWSSHETDQAVLSDTTLAGGLPISTDEVENFGVFLNDATGSKMGTYLDVNVGLGAIVCRSDGRPNYKVQVTLTNTAPADAATTLPAYVTGGGWFGVTAGNIRTITSVYGVPGMENLGVLQDDAEISFHPTTDSGYPVSAVTTELKPGESTVVTYNWLGAANSVGDIAAKVTPGPMNHTSQELTLQCG
ncbi:DUF4012 domain-containing protein [Cryobacterium sp. 1639]|uniref:DUF4012 domain-containing protein n=1 Tax=Cryobacterium inferilacus TaxID=2866629 RepID=UPI001C7380CA|nr:DUF4012 domain-containing protein [Cryobacterium sp. 1639]MBX0302009.1 DUF4012 domain-containing protein [Cryobacterium sp. 1639]